MKSRPYRSLIGFLMYITTCMRPDIAFVVTRLSRFLENPGTQHWKAAIRVLRYLKSTREHGIVYHGGSGTVIAEAFTDADWGSNTDDRRSVSGVMVLIGKAPLVQVPEDRRSQFCRSRVHGSKPLYARGALGARHAEGHGSRAGGRNACLGRQPRFNCIGT